MEAFMASTNSTSMKGVNEGRNERKRRGHKIRR